MKKYLTPEKLFYFQFLQKLLHINFWAVENALIDSLESVYLLSLKTVQISYLILQKFREVLKTCRWLFLYWFMYAQV